MTTIYPTTDMYGVAVELDDTILVPRATGGFHNGPCIVRGVVTQIETIPEHLGYGVVVYKIQVKPFDGRRKFWTIAQNAIVQKD